MALSSAILEPGLIPESFALHQNQPNPGRPGTVIAFDLPKACDMRLQVFDVSGRQVALLTEGEHEAGRHAVTWDGSAPAGVYFYRINARGYEETRKMMIAR